VHNVSEKLTESEALPHC